MFAQSLQNVDMPSHSVRTIKTKVNDL